MALPTLPLSPGNDLDDVVAQVCLTLQISPTQFDLARSHYEAVGEWLRTNGSPLALYNSRIYPQGGMALRTTVRPREREEYDLDFVLEVRAALMNPMALYEMVAQRLAAHDVYRRKLERKKRCLRLNYEHDFHLDILPARPDAVRQGSCIEVPDTALRDWKPSNAVGYITWFERLCEFGVLLKASRQQAPLPPLLPESQLRVLRQVVQLIKRRRDNAFARSEFAPRSIVLTTLAGQAYARQESLVASLEQVLTAIETQIDREHPRAIVVRNPTNPDEVFSEAWSTNVDAYRAFTGFIRDFRREVTALRLATGLLTIGGLLDRMFGDNLGQLALKGYGAQLEAAKKAREMRFAAPGIIVRGHEGRLPPKHTFHHSSD